MESIRHNDDYDREQWLYVPDHYEDFRYLLGTRGERPLLCIGINPSTAEPDNLDPTLKSVQRIANANGFDSFIMCNVYAQRATNPDHMHAEMDEELHKANMQAFEQLLARTDSPVLWVAWGNLIEKRKYLPFCLRDMIAAGEKYEAQWVCAGPVSKRGHPHHPLYLKKEEPLRPFDMNEYINNPSFR